VRGRRASAERIRPYPRIKIVTRSFFAFLLLLLAHGAAARPGEICRFRALDPENPFRRWLASQQVTCAAAGTQLEFEKGLWNVFARAEGTVSAAPLLIDGDAAIPAIEPELGPGATVAPLLPEGHGGVIYAPRRGSAFPVDGARVTVPADEPLWLFVLEKSAPVAVIPIAPLAPRTERQVDGRHGGPAAIVGWLQVPDADRAALAKASGVSTPAVRSGSRDADALPPMALLHGAFFRVRDVAPGNAEVRVEGRGWVPDRRVVKVQQGVTVANVPLRLRATGTLLVHWNTSQNLPLLNRSFGSCDDDEEALQLVIEVSKCSAPPRGERFEEASCAPVREEKVEGFFGSFTFDDVVPGLYRAEMRYGKLPPASAMASVGPLRVADLRVIASYDTVYGRVTRGGEPLGEAVSIEFPTGPGFAPEDSEEYRGILTSPILESEEQIEVAACDGSPRAIVLTDQPMRSSARYDIDIPANELTIQITDTFTREALPGAKVELEAFSVLRPHRVVYTATETADERGIVVWRAVPIRRLQIRISHTGYEKRMIQPFTMPESGTHEIDAQLVPLRGSRGKIVSSVPFENGYVSWYSPAGARTESADLSEDGTFIYGDRHMQDETMAVVSTSHPLWVLRAPETDRRESLTLRFPDAASVAFDVWLAAAVPPAESRYIGVAIGGVRIPQPALVQHQDLRDDPSQLRGAGPLHLGDLLATGPIDVLLGPTVEEGASRGRPLDIFVLPQYANPPRERLEPGTTDVVFTP
jgi:hypothetical protein